MAAPRETMAEPRAEHPTPAVVITPGGSAAASAAHPARAADPGTPMSLGEPGSDPHPSARFVARAPIGPDEMLPAVAQGAIGIEQRTGDDRVAALLAPIHDLETGHRLAAERAFLLGLDGSCQTPIAGLAELDGDRLRLRGEILRPDGSECLAYALEGPAGDGAAMGTAAAAELRGRAGPGFFDA